MRLVYLSVSHIPSRQANSMQVMRMCSAFARQGHVVHLFSKSQTGRTEPGVRDDFGFYGVAPAFEIRKLTRPSYRGGSLVHGAVTIAALREQQPDLTYARSIVGAFLATRMALPTVFEAHAVPFDRWSRWMWRRMVSARSFRRLIVTSGQLGDDLRAEGLVPNGIDIVVAHDAADPLPRSEPASRSSPWIGYVGSLYPGRGIEMVLELARRIPTVRFRVIGGRDVDLAHWKREGVPTNLDLVGFVPPSELAGHYKDLDIVLMPYAASGVRNSGGGSDMSRWMSPLKLFEYMSSGAAIVASNLPVLGEVLQHEHNALMVEASRADAWETAVRRLLDDHTLRRRLSSVARDEMLARHTWDARARIVLRDL